MLLSSKVSAPISTTRHLVRGQRVSLRRQLADGQGDLIGWVLTADADGLELLDRQAHRHRVDSAQILALRLIPLIPPGRNPENGDRSILARMLTDLTGAEVTAEAIAVGRIRDLVDDVTPALDMIDAGRAPSPGTVLISGEWAVLASPPQKAHIWAAWAALHNARNLAWVAKM
ncbi:hypothetical protein FB460_0721 [Propioniferax innocua]|uniref:Uncharacterized protein n=1 Tax=Propioniferax innocua TaxID=1753 RepID=A0A542ZRQ5_9ACTN|nr:hypothetical protein FB460_0721 [Propioniferax innocua]